MEGGCDDELPQIVLPSPEIQELVEVQLAKILHIDNPGLFYLRISQKESYYNQYFENLNTAYNEDSGRSLEDSNLITIGTCWCIYDDEHWHRAKAINNVKPKEPKNPKDMPQFEMLLVDLGESKSIPINHIRILKKQFTLDPPLAIVACLSNVFPQQPMELDSWSTSQKKQFIEFCIIPGEFKVIFLGKALNDLFEVILESPTGVVINEKMSPDENLTSKLDDFIINNNVELSSVNEISAPDQEKNEPLLEPEWDPMADDYKRGPLLDTENLSEVLFGYKNEDEKFICKFYRQGRSCPNGEYCRFQHIKPRDDGLPSTSVQAYSNVYISQSLPKLKSIHRVIVTVVHTPSFFYTQFLSEEQSKEYEDFKIQLNDFYKRSVPNVVQTLLPAIGELMVVCNPPSATLEGCHRVRVVDVDGNEKKTMLVKYIDIGIEEWVEEKFLKSIHPQFLHLPIQIYECWLYGLKPPEEIWPKKSTDFVCNFIQNKFLVAEVAAVDSLNERIGLILLDSTDDKELVLNDELIHNQLALLDESDTSEEESSECSEVDVQSHSVTSR